MGKSKSDAETPFVPGGIPRLHAPELERVVDRIIRALRAGKPARLPGLGTISPGETWTFRRESSAAPHDR